MYSVGYAGYYGLSLIVASPTVLFVSLAAHAAQFGFLLYFENPRQYSGLHCAVAVPIFRADGSALMHFTDIERTYGQRKPIAARTPLPRTLSQTPSESPASHSRAESTVEAASASGFSTPTLIEGHEDSMTEAEEALTEDDDDVDVDAVTRLPAASRKPSLTPSMFSTRSAASNAARRQSDGGPEAMTRHDLDNKYFHKDLLIFRNWDAFRYVLAGL